MERSRQRGIDRERDRTKEKAIRNNTAKTKLPAETATGEKNYRKVISLLSCDNDNTQILSMIRLASYNLTQLSPTQNCNERVVKLRIIAI